MSESAAGTKPLAGSEKVLAKNPLQNGGNKMTDYCNICGICGQELLEDVVVVDTSLDMKPIPFKEVHGDKSDLICIECAIDAVENPPFVCGRCAQPIEFNEKFYVFREAISKPSGPKVDLCVHTEENYICSECYNEIMNPEYEEDEA
jgi:hypothetical protein